MKPESSQTAALLLNRLREPPALALVLGSGFDAVLHALKVEADIPYNQLPGFLPVTVPGHRGRLILGRLGTARVAVLAGRAHYYEGYSLDEITFPIRVLADLGVRSLLLTNAAGGINSKFSPGDFMILTDHINFLGMNPLRGLPPAGKPFFVDLTETYDRNLRQLLADAGEKAGAKIQSGVYLAVSGPSYETPAEIRAFRMLGADAVGMSTVAEAIVARQCGLAVAGLSCISNLAAGCGPAPVQHAEVLALGEQMKEIAAGVLTRFATLYAQSPHKT